MACIVPTVVEHMEVDPSHDKEPMEVDPPLAQLIQNNTILQGLPVVQS